ncbi:unnamed protein product [Paramecium sonneborni]|uniref:Uncharacterized protein n=1 Tax=Paramecium sonneborni TaxID=65129 RepID=A0A8S1QBS7_9CILI|nr:unnamed protein product [Paramecium sonneborni]
MLCKIEKKRIQKFLIIINMLIKLLQVMQRQDYQQNQEIELITIKRNKICQIQQNKKGRQKKIRQKGYKETHYYIMEQMEDQKQQKKREQQQKSQELKYYGIDDEQNKREDHDNLKERKKILHNLDKI